MRGLIPPAVVQRILAHVCTVEWAPIRPVAVLLIPLAAKRAAWAHILTRRAHQTLAHALPAFQALTPTLLGCFASRVQLGLILLVWACQPYHAKLATQERFLRRWVAP